MTPGPAGVWARRDPLLFRELRLPRPSPEHWAALALFTAVSAVFFLPSLLEGRVLFRRDISMVWLPQVEAFVRCVAAGSWPLWDPLAGFGRPLLADPRAEVLYPPTWLNLVMPPGVYFTLFSLGHLAFSGLGLYLLARRWRASRFAGFVAGTVWIASGPLLSLVSMWHHLAAAAWIPWLFLGLDLALDSGRTRHALLAGAALAAQVFAGSPDLTAFTLPLLALYVLARRSQWRAAPGPPLRGPLPTALLALAFGLAVSAVQWLPTLDWAGRSDRPELSYDVRTTWSLHPASLLEVAFPLRWADLPLHPDLSREIVEFKEPWLHSIHLGVAGCALALAGLAGRRPRRGFLALVAVAAVLFALGRHSLAYDATTFLVPPLRMLRYPVKTMVLASFAWSLLAGMGVDAWRGRSRVSRRLWTALVVVPAAVLLGLALAGAHTASFGAEDWGSRILTPDPPGSHGGALAPAAAVLAKVAAVAGLVLLLALVRARRAAPGPWPSAGAGLLAVAGLVAEHRDLHVTAPAELHRRRPEVLPWIRDTSDPRLYVYDYSILTGPQLRNNPGAMHSYRVVRRPVGWGQLETLVLGVHGYLNPPTAARWGLPGSFDRDILGFDPVPLARMNELLHETEDTPTHRRLLQLGAVTHALALTPGAWWDDLVTVAEVATVFERPIRVLSVPDPLPRAYVVSGARIADEADAFATLDDPDFDPRREVILAQGNPRPALDDPGTARILSKKPDRVTIEAELSRDGYLVLVEAHDPGWQARVDGRDAPVLRANVAFRAVPVPAGRHAVELVYRPWPVRLGAAISLAALLAALAARLVRRRGAR